MPPAVVSTPALGPTSARRPQPLRALRRCLGLGLALAVLCLLAAGAASASIFAPYDDLVDFMHAPPADVDAHLATESSAASGGPYFSRPIPTTLHQIWFGDSADLLDADVLDWQAYAERFGYGYHLWTEDDDPTLRRMLGDEAFALMDGYRAARVFMAASDIVRYVLLDQLGGIYLDVDIPTPKGADGQALDLRQALPLEGLIVPLEGLVREVGNGAIYLQNCMLMACPGHPIIHQMVVGMLPNHAKWRAALGSTDRGVWYMTGQHLLSRSLAGAFSVLPYAYLEQIGMAYWQPLEERARRSAIAKSRRDKGLSSRVSSVHRPAPAATFSGAAGRSP